MRARLGVLTVVLTVTIAAPAAAGELYAFDGGESPPIRVTYTAGPLEANRVTANWDESTRRLVVTDAGRKITMARGSTPGLCTVSGDRAVCRFGNVWEHLTVNLGDGDDSFRPSGFGWEPFDLTVSGDEGADLLYAAGEFASLDGGRGADRLFGGPGSDHLSPGLGSDVVSGGDGRDWVSYFDGDLPVSLPGDIGVSVSLDGVANDGLPIERDNVLPDVENIEGSVLADRLEGSAADNVILAAAGDDVIVGGAGRDELWGNSGADTIRARDGEVDDILCDANDRADLDPFDHVVDFGTACAPLTP